MKTLAFASISGFIAEIQQDGSLRELVITKGERDDRYEALRLRCPISESRALTATRELAGALDQRAVEKVRQLATAQ